MFKPTVKLPAEWDTSPESVNLSKQLLSKLKMRCVQQRQFDKQALVDGVTIVDVFCGPLMQPH